MLDTVLEIGKILRASPSGLEHHYLLKRPSGSDKNPVSFWVVPANADCSFNFQERYALQDEYRQEQLLYLDYKDCDTDNKKMYVFGDIYHQVDLKKKIEATGGNFLISDDNSTGKTYQRNSLVRANSNDKLQSFLSSSATKKFRQSFTDQWHSIKNFLAESDNVYIHFDFGGQHWHQLPVIDELHQSILNTYFVREKGLYVLRTFLYKTVSSNENKTCGFVNDRHFRSRTFKDAGEALDLLYGINYASRSSVRKNDFKVIVLPRGEGLEAKQIERFFERRVSSEPDAEIEDAETSLQTNAEANVAAVATEDDEFFLFANDDTDNGSNPILQYDCIFSKAGGTKPDIDMVEIAGISRSKIAAISSTVSKVKREVEAERDAFFLRLYGKETKKFPLTIAGAFLKVINDPSKKKSKYQSHLFRVMPEIFNGTYYQDPTMLPALIEKTEMSIRNGDLFFFNDAKFPFEFLCKIQVPGREYLMKIKESTSYQAGILLGRLAKPLGAGKDAAINSFEKNYVGLLSRRIATPAAVTALTVDINQKLAIHNLANETVRDTATELAGMISNFADRTSEYNKDNFALGFFESYFGR